jgi:hypothetical protein
VPIDVVERNHGKILELTATGKFADADLKRLEPTFSRLVHQHGKIRVLLQMLDFHGWEGSAIWDEVKFDAKHFSEIERLAMVGDKNWEKFLSTFSRPFTTADIRYFDQSDARAARTWLEGNGGS